MKILFYINSLDYGGTERTVSYLSDYFAKKGNEVYIIINTKTINYKINDSVKVFSLKTYSSNNLVKNIINIFKRIRRLRKKIKRIKPDIIITMTGISTIMVNHVYKKAKIIMSERGNPFARTGIRKVALKYAIRHVDGMIFQTKGASKYYSLKESVPTIIIQNAVGNKDIYTLENNFNFNCNILAVGRLAVEKDYPTMLKAFKLVNREFPKYKLKIYGKGPEKNKLIALTKELGLEENVEFKGVSDKAFVENINSRVYLLTSTKEGMPNSLLEAMGLGIPSIATNCEFGPAELIRSGYNGFLVPVKDYKLLAEKIINIIKDEKMAIKFSINSRKILETNSIVNISQKYLDFIEEVFNEKA